MNVPKGTDGNWFKDPVEYDIDRIDGSIEYEGGDVKGNIVLWYGIVDVLITGLRFT